MAKTRQINRRLKAVGNIERITKTMQMIATARFQAALRVVTQSREYAQSITELVGELASAMPAGDDGAPLAHSLLRRAGGDHGRELLLVLTSQRGLCGAYNASVLRMAMAFLSKHSHRQIDLEVVGKKGMAYFRFNRIPVAIYHSQIADKPTYEDVEHLAQRYMAAFAAGTYDVVRVACMTFRTVAQQAPRIQRLLPLAYPTTSQRSEPQQRTAMVYYDFSPAPQTLLAELLPITVKTELFQCFNESVLSEHIARKVAMKNATDSGAKMGKQLKLRFNRARQTAITTELSEIIGGSDGVA